MSASPAVSRKPRMPRLAKWTVIALVILGLLAVAFTVVSALIAKSSLDDAKTDLKSLSKTLSDNPHQTVGQVYNRLESQTGTAYNLTNLPTWRMFEWVPVVGKNLAVFRETSSVLHHLIVDGVGPVAYQLRDVSYDSIKPVNGKINIAPFANLAGASQELNAAVIRAKLDTQTIDTSGTIGQLSSAVTGLHKALTTVEPYTTRFSEVAPLIGPVMGVAAPRHYLLLFQNNAEERAGGGDPGVLGYLSVDDGKISLEKVAAASEGFPHPYASPVLDTFDKDWEHLYGKHITTYISNVTWMPNLDDTAKLATRMWQLQYPQYKQVDGVISFDPVALSYLLNATGPIKLSSGDVIDSQNAVAFLLSDIYVKYPNPAEEDKIFNSAAATIFSSVTRLKGDPTAYLKALTPMINEGRLKMWSANTVEENELLTTPLSGILPVDNTQETRLGVYFNDDATSKMSYYVNASALITSNRCQATPTYQVSTTVVNTITPEAAKALPAYVAEHRDNLVQGQDQLVVMFYGPVNGTFKDLTVDGKEITDTSKKGYPYQPKTVGVDRGRPVVAVRIILDPLQASTLVANFTGTAADSKNVTVSHTPKVHKMPVDIETAYCS